jgi:hypothetical protein
VSTFTVGGLFIGVNGTSTNMKRSVWREVVARRRRHVAERLGGVASVDSSFSSLCRRVATKARAKELDPSAGP